MKDLNGMARTSLVSLSERAEQKALLLIAFIRQHIKGASYVNSRCHGTFRNPTGAVGIIVVFVPH